MKRPYRIGYRPAGTTGAYSTQARGAFATPPTPEQIATRLRGDGFVRLPCLGFWVKWDTGETGPETLVEK